MALGGILGSLLGSSGSAGGSGSSLTSNLFNPSAKGWKRGVANIVDPGGLMGLFRENQEYQRPQYEGLRSLTEIPETAGYTQELERRMGQGPEYWRDSFYKDIYGPAAEQTRSQWGEQVQDPIMSAAGAMGQERASPTIDRLAKELTKRELGLATLAGDLRTKGTQFGKGISESARAGLGQYIGAEGATQQRAGLADLGVASAFGLPQQQAILQSYAEQRAAPQQFLGSAFETAGNLYGMGQGNQANYADTLLNRRSAYGGANRAKVATPGLDRYTG